MMKNLLFAATLLLLSSMTAPIYAVAAADEAAPIQNSPAKVKADDAPAIGSVEERRLVGDIEAERQSVRDERQDLEIEKKALKTLEEGVDKKLVELDAKIAELKRQQELLRTLLAEKSEIEKQKMAELAKIYDKMTPERAAVALSGLDPKLAADLLAHMKTKAAARVLDQTSKQKASELSTTYTTIKLE
ncbi:MAG: hypothetical protein LBU39_10865 [Desulfobulbaceae bacterium]|jgi:flagellar motility protein MotE (MotC chaperone)|nr:hypothetical protein [Desulfobulbaceae bacterium]